MNEAKYEALKKVASRFLRRQEQARNDQGKTYWNVAGAFNHSHIVKGLHSILTSYDVDDQILYQSHDCLPGIPWNGGRVIQGIQTTQVAPVTKEDAVQMVRQYNQLGIGIYLTFSNHLLEEKHLGDPRANFLLAEISYSPLNGVICSSDLLLRYVRSSYPQMKVKLSVIRSFVENIWSQPKQKILDWHKAMFDRYDSMTLNPNLNKTYDVIEKQPLDRLEVLVSLLCEYRCALAHKHYENSARANLYGMTDYDVTEQDFGYCRRRSKTHPHQTIETVQLCNDTVKELRSIGVRHFKIHGKTDNYWELSRYVNYYILNPLGIYANWHLVDGELVFTTWEVGNREFGRTPVVQKPASS